MLRFFRKIGSVFAKAVGGTTSDSPPNLKIPTAFDSGKINFPTSSQEAHERLDTILGQRAHIQEVDHEHFMLGWAAMAYIAPGLNPDDACLPDGNWPTGWIPVAEEALRRYKAKLIKKSELYLDPPSGI